MRQLVARLVNKWRASHNKLIRIAAIQHLGAGLFVCALDVDGRRLILGVSPRTICVLDRYDVPHDGVPAGPRPAVG
jgi:flagellar biogenesis protein FliO